MKTAILPQVRVDAQLRADLEAVLHEGETLSDFLESTVRRAVEHRQVEAAFAARCDAAWANYKRTGISHPVDHALVRMQAKIDAKHQLLTGGKSTSK